MAITLPLTGVGNTRFFITAVSCERRIDRLRYCAYSKEVTSLQRYATRKVVMVLLALSFTFPAPLNLAAVQSRRVVVLPPPSAAKIIHKWANYYGVDKDLALRIAHAESGLNCKVQNKDSSAGGLFQFINSTFLNTQKRLGKPQDISRKYDCDENAELGIYLLSKGELQHWKASRSVWDRFPIGEPEFESEPSSRIASD
jgi:soluble lytic murein transglycosylase-like protein